MQQPIQRLSVFFCLILFGVTSCKEAPVQPQSSNNAELISLTISPNIILFQSSDSQKDTTITLQLSAEVSLGSDGEYPSVLLAVSTRKGEEATLTSTELFPVTSQPGRYEASTSIETNTARNETFLFSVTSGDQRLPLSNTLIQEVEVSGVSIGRPLMIESFQPDTVFLPSSGSINFVLAARVVHPDNQDFIDQATVRLTDQTQTVIGSFQLFDDGSSVILSNNTTSGDQVAADSVFSRVFTISSDNNPDRITLNYFARDISGQFSDTLTSTMVISR